MSSVDTETTATAGSPAPAEVEEDQSADTIPPITEEPETDTETDEPIPGDEDFEDVDYDGQKYRVPKELKDAFLRQSDYTKKTQEVSEQRRALDADKAAIAAEKEAVGQQAAAQQARIKDYGHLASIDAALAQYEKVDWDAWFDQDFIEAQKGQHRRQALIEQRQSTAHKLWTDEQESVRKAQQERETASAKRREEAVRVVSEIKGWSPETDQALRTYAIGQGFSEQDLTLFLEHPRLIKVLHKAWRGDELSTKQQTSTPRASAPPAIPAETVKPLTTVSRTRSRPASTGPSDSDSDELWLAKRNAQLRKKG